MLDTLRIKNIAVIDTAEIPFKPGLNILSGETGAGKSIIIEAISLLLGGRATTDLIRSGCDEGVVEGLFDLEQIPWMSERLKENGFEVEGHQLLIRRSVHRSGKHRIHINGSLATLNILQQLCEGLVDLCGQHEHQSLLKAQTQIELIDRYGGLSSRTKEFSERFLKYRETLHQLEKLILSQNETERRADFIRFQIQELSEASLQPGEDTTLQAQKQLLQSAEARVHPVKLF